MIHRLIRAAGAARALDNVAETKVDDFDAALLVQQQVLGLQICARGADEQSQSAVELNTNLGG